MKASAKEKLISVIEELLRIKKLDDITVSEIVSHAGLCRKTFYRHFKDKYELAAFYFEQFFEETFGQITRGENFDTALLRYLEICEERAAVLKNAYSSIDINGLHNYDIEITRKTYEKYLLAKGADISTPEMKFSIEIAARGGTDMVIKWLMYGMSEDKRWLKKMIKQTLPNNLLIYLNSD